ncbi:MAG: efflux transporter outer membrane subunit [Coprobacillus sp.]|nr:efflux transporter outer membrane subunit [Coprobacillus sp.]
MNLKTIFLAAAGTLVLGSACTMQPEYTRPEAPVPEEFRGAPEGSQALGDNHTAFLGWQNFYKDERLKKYIEIGLANNRDLRVAVLNIEKFAAQYRISRSQLMPGVNAGGYWDRTHTARQISDTGREYTSNTFGANIGLVSYEVDIWGRIRSLKDQAWEEFLQTAETERTVRLTLVSSIALQYFACELSREQLQIAEQSLELAKDYRDLVKSQMDAGTASELDFHQAEAQYQNELNSTEELRATNEQNENAFALLLGAGVPEGVVLPPPVPLSQNDALETVPAGLPSELLAYRPDILSAEHALLAANANIGAARAAFFPSITLNASAGFESTELNQLFKGSSRTWSFSPSVNIPIFSGGRLSAELDVAKLQREVEIANYEKAIQTAFREVSDEFATLNTIRKRVEAQEQALASQKRRYEILKDSYEAGNATSLQVILAQQDYFAAQQNVLGVYYAEIASKITLYKALGGGWSQENFDIKAAREAAKNGEYKSGEEPKAEEEKTA